MLIPSSSSLEIKGRLLKRLPEDFCDIFFFMVGPEELTELAIFFVSVA